MINTKFIRNKALIGGAIGYTKLVPIFIKEKKNNSFINNSAGLFGNNIALQIDFVPKITPMGLNDENKPYNINADTAAGAVARSIKSRRLILLTDVHGVMDDNDKLISEINTTEAKDLINNKIIHGGMIPKVKTCIDAINNGVRAVVIIDGRKPHSILFELFSDRGAGTLIRK